MLGMFNLQIGRRPWNIQNWLKSKCVKSERFCRLMLLYTTVSFFAREPFRRSCLHCETNANWRQTMNVLWLWSVNFCASFQTFRAFSRFAFSPLFALPVVVIFVFIWIYALSTPPETSVKYYAPTVLCYGLAIFIECLAEPLWVLGQSVLFVKLKVGVKLKFNQTVRKNDAFSILYRHLSKRFILLWGNFCSLS